MELLDEPVDILYGGAAATRDALAAAAIEHLWLQSLLGSHRVDDGLHLDECPLIYLHPLQCLSHTRDHAHELIQGTHALDGVQLVLEVDKGEGLFAEAFSQFATALLVDGLLGLLDQGDDVAHAQNARGDAIGVEGLQGLQAFPHADELDRLPRDLAHGKRGSPAGIPVHLGQHTAAEFQPLAEAPSRLHRVLAQHGIGHEQNLVGTGEIPDLDELIHHRVINAEPAGRVQDDDTAIGLTRSFDAATTQLHGIRIRPHISRTEDRHIDRAAQGLQLLHCCRTIRVCRHQLRGPSLLLEAQGKLAGDRGLAAPLQSYQQNDGRRAIGQLQGIGCPTQQSHELVVDDLDDLLSRGEAAQHHLASGLFPHSFEEAAGYLEIDIGLE